MPDKFFYGFFFRPGILNGSLLAFTSAADRNAFSDQYTRRWYNNRTGVFYPCDSDDAIGSHLFAEVVDANGENAGGKFSGNALAPDTLELVPYVDADEIERVHRA